MCSQGIGVDELLKDFNGLYYMVEGRKHPVPRIVWERYICDKYKGSPVRFSPKYVNKPKVLPDKEWDWKPYLLSVELRRVYREIRDNDPVYKRYVDYWSLYSKLYEKARAPVIQRIYALDERKYMHYKTDALHVLERRKQGIPFVAPNSNCRSYFMKWLYNLFPGFAYSGEFRRWFYDAKDIGQLPFLSRPNTATDTKYSLNDIKRIMESVHRRNSLRSFQEYCKNFEQLSFI